MVMPAANESLREYSMYGRRGYSDPKSPLPSMVVSVFIKIIESEIKMFTQKNEAKEELAVHEDFNKFKAFNHMS
jgi:hypothetical protein